MKNGEEDDRFGSFRGLIPKERQMCKRGEKREDRA